MRRRSPFTLTLVALVMVAGNLIATQPDGAVRAADPAAELARTQQQLAEAQAAQQRAATAAANQRAQLASLRAQSAQLGRQLEAAKAELAAVTAEYDRISGLLIQVGQQVAAIEARIAELKQQIETLEAELDAVAADIERRTGDLKQREALLEDHMRAAYQRSQTSLLETLLAANSLDEAATEVGYLMTITEADRLLAEEIRAIREELETRRATLKEGRRTLALARRAARAEEKELKARQAELAALEASLAQLKAAAEIKRAEQEAALNASLAAQANVEGMIANNEAAASAASSLAANLRQLAASQQAAIDEARRQAEAAARAGGGGGSRGAPSSYGFRWPEAGARITQEFGPTSFQLEPPYTYGGTYYPHFHTGIDFAAGCGARIYAAGPGVVVASGQPLLPWDSGYGVIVDHGGGIQTWYWHMQPRVVVGPGSIVTGDTVIGYEGSTGMSTGCHVHFAVNHWGGWENPRHYLP